MATNPFYNATGNPQQQTRGTSPQMRAEFALIQAGFAMLPVPAAIAAGYSNYAGLDTGAANAYMVSLQPTIVLAYTDGMVIRFKAANSNTGASTVNLNNLGLKSITRPDGTALQAGDITANGIVSITYNSTSGTFMVGANLIAYMNAAAASALAASNSAAAAAISAGQAAAYAAALSGTSTDSVAIGPGAKNFPTSSTAKQWVAGQFLVLASGANNSNYMHGQVTSYNSGTGALVMNVTDIGGGGTFADWIISVSGTQGTAGTLGGNATAGINELKGADIASTATLSSIWLAAEGNTQTITGTTPTTSLGTAPQAGAKRTLLAAAAWPLTNGANLILPGGVNYTCTAGDRLEVLAVTTTQHRVSIFKQDGTPVVGAPSGLVCLAVATVSSNTAAVDFTSVITSTYDEYEIHFQTVVPDTAAAFLTLRTSSDNGVSFDAGASDYDHVSEQNFSGNTAMVVAGSTAATFVPLCPVAQGLSTTAANGGTSGVAKIFAPSSSVSYKHIDIKSTGARDSANYLSQFAGAGRRVSATAVNAVRLLFNTGNIASGLFKLYGVRKTV